MVEEGRLETVDSGQSTRHYSLSPDSGGCGGGGQGWILSTHSHTRKITRNTFAFIFIALSLHT